LTDCGKEEIRENCGRNVKSTKGVGTNSKNRRKYLPTGIISGQETFCQKEATEKTVSSSKKSGLGARGDWEKKLEMYVRITGDL